MGFWAAGRRAENMTDILPYLERIRDRFADPALHATFKTFSKTLQFEFPDTQQFFALAVVNGQATLADQGVERPDIKVIADTDILSGILDRKVNPMTAYMTRKVKVQGAQADVMKLQKLLF
jgi:putative sterol carrier protein